jgi:hypothetical protein
MRIESEDAKGDRKAIMAAARAAMQAANPGVSPRARGVEKTRLVLNWVYRWGWASSSTIEIIGGVKRSGLGRPACQKWAAAVDKNRKRRGG